MKYFITGGAGFIGSNLVDRLLSQDEKVVVYDNFSTGRIEFLDNAKKNPNFELIRADLLDKETLVSSMSGSDFVVHFAANADVRFGLNHPSRDLEQNTIVTFNVLEAMRANQIKHIAFSSTGSIYGEASIIPTPEDHPFPIQTSLYGASKLAGEGLIQAYSEGFGFVSYIFRFVSILGERYTHGHVYDFYQKLKENPNQLYILGDGKQKKSYLYIQDCLDAIQFVIAKSKDKVNLYNLGTDEYCMVTDSAGWIAESLKLSPQFEFSGGDRGWIGDNPFIFLSIDKIKKLGWTPKHSIKDSILKTLDFLKTNPWVYKV